MSADYGTIDDYSVRGFGFVTRTLQDIPQRASRVFFHIKTIKRKCPELAGDLDNGVYDGTYDRVGFWYETESTSKGDQVTDLWLEVKDIPEPQRRILTKAVEHRWQDARHDLPDELHVMTQQLMGQEAYVKLRGDRERRIHQQREAQAEQQRLAEEQREKAEAERHRLAEEERQRLAAERRLAGRWESSEDWQKVASRLREQSRNAAAGAVSHGRIVPSRDPLAQMPAPPATGSPVKPRQPAPTDSSADTDWWFRELKTAGDQAAAMPIDTKVVGVTFENRQSVVKQMSEGEQVWLRREPTNSYDANAIRVERQDGQQIGYIDRHRAALWAPTFDVHGHPVPAVVTAIVGGGYRDSSLGVRIRFTLPAATPNRPPDCDDFDDNWEL